MKESLMQTNQPDSLYSMGQLDAWTKEEHKSLPKNFLPIRQFSDISENDKIFLCGRRGTGKSAIAKMLEAHEPSSQYYREAIQGERSEYGTYVDIVQALSAKRNQWIQVDIKQSVRRLWMWVIPVKAMQTVLNQATKRDQQLDSNLTIIKKYFDSLPPPLYLDSKIGDFLCNTFDTALKLVEQDLSAFNTFLVNLTGDQLFKNAFQALHHHCKHQHVLLVFDTLESYKIFNREIISGLQGILETIITLLTDPLMSHIHVKFFLPAEIYEKIFSGFPAKVESRAVFLRWRTGDLISMLARRYLAILERTKLLDNNKLLELTAEVDQAYSKQDGHHLRNAFWYNTGFLPSVIKNRLDEQEDTFAYIIRHTHRRPRDLITIFQSIVDQARHRNEFPYISNQSVMDGVHDEGALSRILADALVHEGEYSSSLLEAARAAFYGKHSILTFHDLRRFAQQMYNIKAMGDVDPDDFLQVLFRCGVIGVVSEKEPRQKEVYCKASFEYLMHDNLPMQTEILYCVHPVMANLFKMVRTPGRGAIYPMPGPQEDDWLEKIASIK